MKVRPSVKPICEKCKISSDLSAVQSFFQTAVYSVYTKFEKGSECAKYGLINPVFAYALGSHK